MARFANVAVVTAALIGLAACGSSGDDASSDGGSAPSAAPSAATADQTFPGMSAEQVLAKAKAAATSATAVTVSGSVGAAPQKADYTFNVVDKKGVAGTVSLNGADLRVIKVGETTYAQPSKKFLDTLGPMGASAAAAIGSKWLVADMSALSAVGSSMPAGAFDGLSKYTTAGSTVSGSLPSDATLTRVAGKTIDGVQTTGIMFSGTAPAEAVAAGAPAQLTGTMYIAAAGKPYPVAVESTTGGSVQLTAWNKPAPVKAPPKKDQVTLAALGLPGMG